MEYEANSGARGNKWLSQLRVIKMAVTINTGHQLLQGSSLTPNITC